MSEASDVTSVHQTASAIAVSQRLEEARSTGGWLMIAGFVLGCMWWGAIAGIVLGAFGISALSEVSRPILIGLGVIAAVPGALMIMAGYMARANRRASAANAIVMEAAVRLLTPAEAAGREGHVLADQMKQAAHEIDLAMSKAMSAMKAMSSEIGDERMRLESVSYASADNARDLTTRLAGEREALESLARDLRAQIGEMNEAIPRQAALMVEAAKQAGEEVARADQALEGRLQGMKTAGEDLARKLVDLDALAKEASSRTENLTFAVSRVEEKLDQSRKTVDAALRAGEAAAAAASTTGDALRDAVSSALDGARLANTEINQSTRAAAEQTARTLAELRIAGQAAAAAVESAGRAARSEIGRLPVAQARANESETSPIATAESSETAAIVPPANTPAEPADDKPAPAHVNGANGHDTPSAVKPPVITPSPSAESQVETPAARPRFMSASDTTTSEDELFDASADALAAAALTDNTEHEDRPNPLTLRRRFDDVPLTEEEEAAVITAHPVDRTNGHDSVNAMMPTGTPAPAQGDMGWRDILSDIDRGDTPPIEGREEIAEALLERLQDSGIRLPEAFRPKAKRKIANAARNGEAARRSAINNQVGKQVDRVAKRLRADRDLMHLARQFHILEEEDALNALEQTQKTNRNASARLAAYLLLDAAGI